MSVQGPLPLYQERETFYVPYFEIIVRGNPMPRSVIRDVIEVRYEDHIDKIDSFSLTVNNWDAENRRPKYVGMEKPPTAEPEKSLVGLFEPNTELELYMGYRDNLRLMMKGFITTLEPDFPASGAPTLSVRGLNLLDKLRKKQYTWAWPSDKGDKKGITDSEIARDLSRPPDRPPGRPGLVLEPRFEVRTDPEAARAEERRPYVFMDNEYPIVFLMRLARRHGYTIFVEEEKLKNGQTRRLLHFGPTQNLHDVTYELEWGRSLVSFRPTLTTANQISKVTVHGWNRRTRRPIVATAQLGDPDVKLNLDLHAVAREAGREEIITDQPVHTLADAKKLARDTLLKQLKEIVRAEGATVGLPDLRAGRMLEIRGVGYRFNGRYFVTATTHTINDSGYRTTFSGRREETGKGQ